MNKSKSATFNDVNVNVNVEASNGSNPKITVIEHKKPPYSSTWGFISFEEMFSVMENKNITRESLRVLALILKIMEYENKITVSQIWITKQLLMSPSQVSRCFKNLIENGILFKEIDEFDRHFYRVNPDICWRGSSASLDRYFKQRADQELREMFA